MSTQSTSSHPEIPKPGHPHRRWTTVLAWIFSCLAVLLLFVIVTVTILLHSARFHNYLLTFAENKATQSLGTQVKLQNFAVHLSNLSLDLYGVTVYGADPHPTPPLLLVRHAEVGVRIVSALRRKWYLDDVRVDDPVVRIVVDANGVSNIPAPKSNGGSSHIDVFELGVRHVVLDQGEAYYNNQRSILEADLHDLNFRSAFDTFLQRYSGTLSYRNGHLEASGFSPISHDLDVQFDATRDTFHITQATITSGSSRFLLTATLENYRQPNIQAKYDAMLDGGDLRRICRNTSIPTGTIRTSGSVEYQYDPHVALLNAVTLNGNLSSRQLNAQLSNLRAQINNVAGQYSLSNGNLAVRNLRARLLGGSLNATLDMRNITGASQSKLTATLRGISLADLKRMAPSNATSRQLSLGGILDATANASWGKNLDDLVARSDATIRASVSRAGTQAGSTGVVPVNGDIQGTYSAATKQIALSHSFLRTPQTSLTMNGTIGNRSGLALQLQSQNVAELETIADLFRTPKPGEPVEPLGLAGTASFQGVVHGTTNAPHLAGELMASNLQVKGTKWKMLLTDVEASPSLVSLQHADLEPASNGRITFNASARLTHWSFTRESPVQLELHASQINVSDLEKIAGKQIPVSGSLTANISAHGTILDPIGHGNVTLTHANAYDEPIQSANLSFTGADNQIHGKLAAHIAAGTIQATVSVRPDRKSYVAQLTANGIRLDQLAVLKAHNINVKGQLNAHASGQGTFDNPQLDATLQIPQLEIQQQKIQAITLKMDVANHVVTANLNSQAIDTSIEAAAKVNLTGDYLADASLNTKPIALQPLLAMYGPSEIAGFAGETEVHATLHGPLKEKKLLQIQAVLPMLKLSYGSTIQLAAASPIHIDYKNGVIDLQRTAIRGTDTDLQIQGSIPTTKGAPVSLLLLGTVDLQLAQLFNPDIRSSGQLKFNINSYGARADSNVEGQVQIVNASFAGGDLPLSVQRGNGVLTLTQDRLNIQSFKATVGGGTLTAQGGLAYRPSIQFDMGASAKGVRMLYPQGVREEVDADLRLAGTSENAILGGRVRIQNLSFTPDFDLMNFVGQLSSGVAPPPTQGFSQDLQLNLAVSSTNDLNLVSRALSVNGTANLQVRGTAAQPVILGRINLSDGDLIFNGTRFTLAGGTIEFVNPSETQPVVNLTLNTTIQQYNISLRFNGPVDKLRTNYSSDPSLPAADIINLLAFGQTTEATAANPTPGDQAAMSAVASQVSSQITSRVAKVAGISQLSINPVLAGGSTAGPAGAVVTVQQRVTGNLFVTFSSNVTSSQSQVIMGQYQLSPRVAVSATRDQNGGFGFDTTFKKSW